MSDSIDSRIDSRVPTQRLWAESCSPRTPSIPTIALIGAAMGSVHHQLNAALGATPTERSRTDTVRSIESLDLGVLRRCNSQRWMIRALEVGVEKAVHAVRGNGKLATSLDMENTEHAERAEHDVALQQGQVVVEEEMVAASNHYEEASICGQAIVNRSYVGHDLAAHRVGRASVVA